MKSSDNLIPQEILDEYARMMKQYQLRDQKLFDKLRPVINNPTSLEAKFRHCLLHDLSDWSQAKVILERFNSLGWDRLKLYEVTRYVQFNEETTEEQSDDFAEIMKSLSGNCSFHHIIRLPNEPQDEQEFIQYLSSIKGW